LAPGLAPSTPADLRRRAEMVCQGGAKAMSNFTLRDLEKRVHERAKASAHVSYTRRLLDQGVAHCAKKLGEEAIETVLAAVEEDRARLIAEAADLIYHLLVVLEARGLSLAEVEAQRAERGGRSGLPERGSRNRGGARTREHRPDAALSPSRIFSRAEGAARRAATPMTLNPDEVTRLRSLHDRLD